MARRSGQKCFDYAMNACEEATKLLIAMQHTYESGDAKCRPTYREMIAQKHDRLMEKRKVIHEAAEMINEALAKLYDLDLSEFI